MDIKHSFIKAKPDQSFQYKLPANFDANNPEFAIFQNVVPEICLAPKINFLKKVRIATNSVVFNYFKIVQESCITENNYQEYQKGYKFFLKFIFPKFNFSKKTFLLITDEWTSNYYHWHIFALKKLVILKSENLLENSLLFLPKKYQRYKFALASLEKFGIKKNQIVFLRRKSNIKVANLALVKDQQQHQKLFQEIRKTLLENAVKKDFGFGDKVYISREGQVLRYVENETEVVALLEKYGFKKIIAEKFSYDEQINICRDIKYLVSPHGAGLTNILFMAENSSILEMASKPCGTRSASEYRTLASMLDINYFYQECPARGKIQDFHQGSLLVDLEKLEKNLKLMLK